MAHNFKSVLAQHVCSVPHLERSPFSLDHIAAARNLDWDIYDMLQLVLSAPINSWYVSHYWTRENTIYPGKKNLGQDQTFSYYCTPHAYVVHDVSRYMYQRNKTNLFCLTYRATFHFFPVRKHHLWFLAYERY